jgi:hypothetical protein
MIKTVNFQGDPMSTKVSFPFFALTLFVTLMGSAHAGPRSGGGGDPRCAEFSNLMGEVVKTLAIVGQDKLNSINPLVRLEDLIKVKRNLRCLPVEELDREAISYPADGHTDLLVSEWENQGMREKLSLTTHEMCVLAGYENDGEYYVSEDLVKAVRANSRKINDQMNAEQVIENNDGSTTFVRPFAVMNGQKFYFGTEARYNNGYLLVIPMTSGLISEQKLENPELLAQGICKYLQYQTAVAFSQNEAKGDQYAAIDQDGRSAGIKTKEGSSVIVSNIVATFIEVSKIHRFESVTCK